VVVMAVRTPTADLVQSPASHFTPGLQHNLSCRVSTYLDLFRPRKLRQLRPFRGEFGRLRPSSDEGRRATLKL
jgi:hypothetical protein